MLKKAWFSYVFNDLCVFEKKEGEEKDSVAQKDLRRTGIISEVGVKDGAERRPPPGIQAQHPAPAPHASHARHDRSMARDDFGG